MSEIPATVTCTHIETMTSVTAMTGDHAVIEDFFRRARAVGGAKPARNEDSYSFTCSASASRVYGPPAAVHFKGSGFYSTDVKSRIERRRRPNVADDLPRGDMDTHRIAKAI